MAGVAGFSHPHDRARWAGGMLLQKKTLGGDFRYFMMGRLTLLTHIVRSSLTPPNTPFSTRRRRCVEPVVVAQYLRRLPRFL